MKMKSFLPGEIHVTFEAVLDNLQVDPFLDSVILNIAKEFIKTCAASAQKLFKKEITWNNTRTIFWIYND